MPLEKVPFTVKLQTPIARLGSNYLCPTLDQFVVLTDVYMCS